MEECVQTARNYLLKKFDPLSDQCWPFRISILKQTSLLDELVKVLDIFGQKNWIV
jgi:hypothetical protein